MASMNSENYEAGPIKFLVISQQMPQGSRNESAKKCQVQADNGAMQDKDYVHLYKRFISKFKPEEGRKDNYQLLEDKTVAEFFTALDQFVEDEAEYKCFFFIFLTYTSSMDELGRYSDDTIHFKDGRRPLSQIWDRLKTKMVARPKVFIVQADDMSLIKGKQITKGTEPIPAKKVPQEADRLIIQSTIPSVITGKDKPSLLIEAFLEAMEDNNNKAPNEKLDLFSATVDISARFDRKLKELPYAEDNWPIPLVTSTLSRFLCLPRFYGVPHEGTPV